MKKIIAALDALNLKASIMDYAVYLAREFDAFIVASFLEEIVYHSHPVEHNAWWPYNKSDIKNLEKTAKSDEAVKNKSLRQLQKKFESSGIHFTVHKDKFVALQPLLNESHFADMIIIDAHANFSNFDKSKPSHFIRNLLADAACPILLVPEKFKPVERFVFAYDGSPSSVYAIKQFTYIFPQIADREIEIVMVNSDKTTSHLPHHTLLKELLKQRYRSVLQSVLRSRNITEALTEHLKTENKNCMVIMGAYKRSTFSMWLHHSAADQLINELNIPLFITHN